MKHTGRYISFMAIALLFSWLFFGCVDSGEPEESATVAATTVTTTEPLPPAEPIDPDNPLVGAWITQEGGGVFTREGRGFAELVFFGNHTGKQECGYHSYDLIWQVTMEGLMIERSSDDFIEAHVYTMELNGNELRLDGILFTRTTSLD